MHADNPASSTRMKKLVACSLVLKFKVVNSLVSVQNLMGMCTNLNEIVHHDDH